MFFVWIFQDSVAHVHLGCPLLRHSSEQGEHCIATLQTPNFSKSDVPAYTVGVFKMFFDLRVLIVFDISLSTLQFVSLHSTKRNYKTLEDSCNENYGLKLCVLCSHCTD